MTGNDGKLGTILCMSTLLSIKTLFVPNLVRFWPFLPLPSQIRIYDPGLPGLGTESPELAGDCQGLGTQSPVLGWGWHCSHQQANADSVASLALCVAWSKGWHLLARPHHRRGTTYLGKEQPWSNLPSGGATWVNGSGLGSIKDGTKTGRNRSRR